MVSDALAQHDSENFLGLVRADRFALAQLERERGGTQRIAFPFPVRVSGGYDHPIGRRVIGATRGGGAFTDLSGRCGLQPMARPGREKLRQRVSAKAGLRSHHMDAFADLSRHACASRASDRLVSLDR